MWLGAMRTGGSGSCLNSGSGCSSSRQQWGWVDGTGYTGYYKWASSKPDEEDCGAQYQNGYWFDQDCDELYPFVCQRGDDCVCFYCKNILIDILQSVTEMTNTWSPTKFTKIKAEKFRHNERASHFFLLSP